MATTNILNQKAEEMAAKRAAFIEDVIKSNVPKWKLDLLKKYNRPWLRWLIRARVEIVSETLIANFGIQTLVKLNGKVIGQIKFSSEEFI